MMVTREFAIGQGADPANLRTWTKSGVQFLVMFTPVPANREQICQQNFDKAVNQMLDERIGPNRHSRCMIPQPDGTEKPCPKVKDGNHAPCATCPHKGEYKKEDRSTVSYEELDDENYAPMECAPSAPKRPISSRASEKTENDGEKTRHSCAFVCCLCDSSRVMI
jgi:hypothetical protein